MLEDIKRDLLSTIDAPRFNYFREKIIREHGLDAWREVRREMFQRPFKVIWAGCHLCKSLDREIVDENWHRCMNCKTLYQPIAKPRGVSPLKDNQVSRSTDPKFIERVKTEVMSLGGKDIIDVGCGSGWLSEILWQEGQYSRVVALDIPLREIKQIEGVERYNVDMEIDGVPDELKESFDVVVCWQVIEHVKRPDLWFGLMAELLKPKGLLYCTYCPEEGVETPRLAEWRYSSLKGLLMVAEKSFAILKTKPRSVLLEKR